MNHLCFAFLSLALVYAAEANFYHGHRYHYNRFLDDDIQAQTDFLETLQKQMRSFFYDRHLQLASVNVTDDAYVTTLPLQGFKKEDINVKITQNILSVVAQNSTRFYSYTYIVPEDAQLNATTARHYEDGYLVLHTPRVQSVVGTTEVVVTNTDTEDEIRYNVTPDTTSSFSTNRVSGSPEEGVEESPRPNYGLRPINPDAEILEDPELSRVKANRFRKPELIGFSTTAPDLLDKQDANQLDNDVIMDVQVV